MLNVTFCKIEMLTEKKYGKHRDKFFKQIKMSLLFYYFHLSPDKWELKKVDKKELSNFIEGQSTFLL